MEFTAEEVEEFKSEALELLDEAERSLLSLEKGANFVDNYAATFRVFHSLKGGAGMLGMKKLQSHMHQLENHYQECKSLQTIPASITSYFLSGIDATRKIISGSKVEFDYSLFTLKPGPTISAPPATSTEPSASVSALFNAEGTKIMIIDDEVEIVEILQDLLTEAGFDVTGFSSPQLALEQLFQIKPDVVMTDFKMPGITGFDVLKSVTKMDPDLSVIYLSGHLSKETILQSLGLGIFAVLEKPFKGVEVVTACKNAAERTRAMKLLNNTISFIYYQYSDLDQYLQLQGAKEIREQMNSQFKLLIDAKRRLKSLKKSAVT